MREAEHEKTLEKAGEYSLPGQNGDTGDCSTHGSAYSYSGGQPRVIS